MISDIIKLTVQERSDLIRSDIYDRTGSAILNQIWYDRIYKIICIRFDKIKYVRSVKIGYTISDLTKSNKLDQI